MPAKRKSLAFAPRLMDQHTAAAYCGVSINTFRTYCPVQPFDGFGAKKLWDREAIDRWVDASRVGGSTSRFDEALERM